MAAIKIEPYTRADHYKADFAAIADSLTEQFRSRGVINDSPIPEGAIKLEKYAASAAISEPLPDLSKHLLHDLDGVRLGMQVVKARYGGVEGHALCFPGGAVMSAEEHAWVAEHPDQEAPGNLYYQIAQDEILKNGRFDCHYPDWQVTERSSLEHTLSGKALSGLKGELERELGEELGQKAESMISLEKIFDGAKCTTLATINLPSIEKSAAIAEKYAHLGVTFDGKTLSHIYTTVEEYFGIATTPYLDPIANIVGESDETYGFEVKTVSEISERGWRAVFEPGAHNDIGEYDIRNPSTAIAMVKLMDFFQELIAAQDTYVEGPRRKLS